jgi:hypothetical protein
MSPRIVAWFAYASGTVGLIGVVLLVIFFIAGNPYGTLNDIAIAIQYLLAVPLWWALHRTFRGQGGRLNTVATWLGITGIAAAVLLQLLLIFGVLSFEQQVGPFSAVLFLGVGGWILITAWLGRLTHRLRYSLTLGVIGWTYVGYPIWAFGVGRQLRSRG